MACSILNYAQVVPVTVRAEDWFAGNTCNAENYDIRFRSNGAMDYRMELFAKSIRKNPLALVYQVRMFPHIGENYVFWTRNHKEHALAVHKNLWGTGLGHGNPDYKMLLDVGTKGIREKIAKYRTVHSDKGEFYDSLECTLDAFELLAKRYRDEAKKQMQTASEEEKIALRRMADALENVPRNKPRNFFEAVQFFWLAFSFLEIDSPGLFDYALGKYYDEDDSGIRYACLQKLWELFYKTRSWNLCIGGSDEKGNDLCCDLTYDILKVAREYRYNTPNITMRFHKNSPERAWKEAAATLATGIGMPAVYNDECVCTALENLGIPPQDSHLYCMNGCNQIDIFGKSHMGLEDGEFCVAKALEYLLFRGRCQHSHQKLGLDLGNPEKFTTFDEFLQAFFRETDYMADTVTRLSNEAQAWHARFSPNPWRSNLIEGCIEKGVDYKCGGPLYGHGQILTEGLTDTADSLTAIKHFVFDTRKYTLKTLVTALKKNFVGYSELYRDFSTYHKFGNDLEDADEMYATIYHHIYRYFLKIDTFRGGKFGVGCSTFERAANYGRHLGALPNGKRKEDSLLADSIGAVPGCDTFGPTALLNSVLKVDQTLATSGNVMQMKFPKAPFQTPVGQEAFIALAKTYFRQGGQTLQINVVSKEELLDAKIHPERHQNLIVRVGGFSQYFVRLEEGLQDNIIQRTENEL